MPSCSSGNSFWTVKISCRFIQFIEADPVKCILTLLHAGADRTVFSHTVVTGLSCDKESRKQHDKKQQ